MQKSPDGQYEVVLENRQVLTIFFAVVVLCGVFFGLGYTVGKNTVGYIPPVEAAQGPASGKKSAMQPVSGSEAKEEALPQPPQLTYDKTLEEKTTVAKLEPAPAPATQPAAVAAAPQPKPAAAAPSPVAATPAEGTITLQIAALSKKDDADSLLGLLTRKGIRAHLVNTSADKLYRVQVGPFATMRDADEMKSRLEQEGFKPIKK